MRVNGSCSRRKRFSWSASCVRATQSRIRRRAGRTTRTTSIPPTSRCSGERDEEDLACAHLRRRRVGRALLRGAFQFGQDPRRDQSAQPRRVTWPQFRTPCEREGFGAGTREFGRVGRGGGRAQALHCHQLCDVPVQLRPFARRRIEAVRIERVEVVADAPRHFGGVQAQRRAFGGAALRPGHMVEQPMRAERQQQSGADDQSGHPGKQAIRRGARGGGSLGDHGDKLTAEPLNKR